jgi:uncharacterized membrane protein
MLLFLVRKWEFKQLKWEPIDNKRIFQRRVKKIVTDRQKSCHSSKRKPRDWQAIRGMMYLLLPQQQQIQKATQEVMETEPRSTTSSPSTIDQSLIRKQEKSPTIVGEFHQ